MYVAAPIDLESASVTSPLVVDVVVTDGAANTVTCAVSVAVEDVNDHCPVFAQKSYQLVFSFFEEFLLKKFAFSTIFFSKNLPRTFS